MPIFQDPEAQGREYSCWSPALPLRRPTTPQQQYLQQHLQHQQRHEQPDLADEEDDEMILDQSSADQNMETACHGPPTSSREELIRRIKDGQSPTWIPNRAVSNLFSAGLLLCSLSVCFYSGQRGCIASPECLVLSGDSHT